MEAKWMLVAMVCFLPQLLLGNEWTPADRACTCLYKATCSYLTASQNLHGGDMIRDMMPGCTILECTSSETKIQLPPTSVLHAKVFHRASRGAVQGSEGWDCGTLVWKHQGWSCMNDHMCTSRNYSVLDPPTGISSVKSHGVQCKNSTKLSQLCRESRVIFHTWHISALTQTKWAIRRNIDMTSNFWPRLWLAWNGHRDRIATAAGFCGWSRNNHIMGFKVLHPGRTNWAEHVIKVQPSLQFTVQSAAN